MSSPLQRHVSPGIAIAYSLALLLVIAIGILAALRLNQIGAAVDNLANDLAVERALADDVVSQVLSVRFYANKYVRTQVQADLDLFNAEFVRLEELLRQADQQITNPERVELLNRIEPAVAGYGSTFKQVAELISERQGVHSEVLGVQELTIGNKLTALRMHVLPLNEPLMFLSLANAQNAFQLMLLNATKYLETGDERYFVLFEGGYQQAQAAFRSLEATLQDSTQRANVAEAKAAMEAYADGFQAIRAGQLELKGLFTTRLDVLEPQISDTASEIAASVEREFKTSNELSQALIAQTRLVLLTTTLIAIAAGLGLGIVMSRYITERARAEAELRQHRDHLDDLVAERTAQLMVANEEVKQFAYIVSHDLRAPLVNLKGFSSELRLALEDIVSSIEQALPYLDEQQRQTLITALEKDVPEALRFIESSVTRMDHFISAVLKLSRLGRRELTPEPVDMEALVRAVLEPLGHQIEQNQVQVSVGALPRVVADRTSMEQIMGNILGNALKYLEPDRPGVIEVTADRHEDEVVIHVRDNGRGIAKDDMGKVFAPFRRAGRQDVPGEGMGLAYVQTMVRQHGGRIWCESELGQGTTFHFTIPTLSTTDSRHYATC